jgi:nucleoid-associated protein YgaU
MVAALQAPPRVRTDGKRGRIERVPARVVPLRLVPDDLIEERLVVVHRQPRPRATRSKRAVYMRRRVIAASLGLGIVLTAAHAGLALGGSTTTPGRSPHPQFVSVVVQRGDTLWSIAERIAPSSNTADKVDEWAEQLGTSDVQAGQGLKLRVS